MTKTTNYVSETTKFVKNYLKDHPKVVAEQKQLRKTWWDTTGIDQAEQKEYKDSKVALDGYAYFSYPTQK